MERQPSDKAIRKQWGGFLSRASQALGDFKDAVVRSSQIGKIKLDATFLRRERETVLQRLGAEVFALAEAGELDLPAELDGLRNEIRGWDEKLDEQAIELAAVEAEAELQRRADREAREAAREAAIDMAPDKYETFGEAEPAQLEPAAEAAELELDEAPAKKSVG